MPVDPRVRTSSSPAASLWRRLALILGVTVAVHFIWEVGQSPLYTADSHTTNLLLHCFIASLGDGLIVLTLLAVVALVRRRAAWFVNPTALDYVVLMIAGASIAVAIEWAALHLLERWRYAEAMPLVPGTTLGWLPVLQMLLLPPLALIWSRSIDRRRMR